MANDPNGLMFVAHVADNSSCLDRLHQVDVLFHVEDSGEFE